MFKIIAAIPREEERLAHHYSLETNKLARIVFGGTIFEIGTILDSEEEYKAEQVFDIPKILQKHKIQLFLECSDGVNSNFSWLTFGLNGQRMRPFHVFKKPNPNSVLYYSPNGAIQIVFSQSETFIVLKMLISQKNNQIFYRQELIWSGFINEAVPTKLLMIEATIVQAYNLQESIKFPEEVVNPIAIGLQFKEESDSDEDLNPC